MEMVSELTASVVQSESSGCWMRRGTGSVAISVSCRESCCLVEQNGRDDTGPMTIRPQKWEKIVGDAGTLANSPRDATTGERNDRMEIRVDTEDMVALPTNTSNGNTPPSLQNNPSPSMFSRDDICDVLILFARCHPHANGLNTST